MNLTLIDEIHVVNRAEMPGEITLRELNVEEAKKFMGATVFVGILMIIGIIGNLHVLYVYTLKMKPSTLRVFVLCLTLLDMLTCSIGMPFVLYDLTHPLTFFVPFVCKALRFLTYFNTIASALIIVLVSVERYRKICVPLGRQLTVRSSKVCCSLVIILSLLISWPPPVLFGLHAEPTNAVNITGSRCFIDDQFKDKSYLAYFNIFLITLFAITSLVLIVLYALIGREVRYRVLRTMFMTDMRNKEKFSKSDEVVDKKEKVSSKRSAPHSPITTETDSDTGKKSTDVSNKSDLGVDSVQKGIRELKRNKLDGYEAKTDSNETHQYTSEIQESKISRQGDVISDFHRENTDRTEIKLRSDKAETKVYFSIQKYSQNMDDSPLDHGNRKPDATVTKYEAGNNVNFNNMDSNICPTGTNVANTDDGLTSSAFQTTCGTSGKYDAPSSQETDKPILGYSGAVLNLPNTVTTDGVAMKTQKNEGADKAKSNSNSTGKNRDISRRATLIVFFITLVYFFSFLPHLITTTLIFVKKDFLSSLNFSERVAYHIFIWSFLINSIANPFIYGFYDKRFKKEVKMIYHRTCSNFFKSGNNKHIS